MDRPNLPLLTGAALALLPSGTALAAIPEMAAASAAVPFGFILTGTVAMTLAGVAGAIAAVGGAAAGTYALRQNARKKRQESQDRASTLKALNELDTKIYGGKRQSFDTLQAGLASICGRDSKFDADKFCKLAESLFVRLQQARSAGDLKALHPYLSDGLCKNLEAQIAIDSVHQRRVITGDVTIRQSAIVGIEIGDEFDALHVAIASRLRTVDVLASMPPEKQQQKLERAPLSDCAETWTFLRKPIPDANRKGGFISGTCPTCGAQLPTSGTTTCSCGAVLNSGTGDWVLTQIVEANDFRISDTAPEPIDGFARLQALDPSVTRQCMEDRAKVVFWSRLSALAQNQIYSFARFAQPQALIQLSSEEAGLSIGRVLGGKIDLVQIVSDIDCERAWFRVRWQELRRDPSGRSMFDVTNIQMMQLARKNGCSTATKAGLSSARCPSCSAEITTLGENGCPACKKSLGDDWCFAELITPETFQARQRAQKQNLTHLADRIGVIADPWDRRRAFTMMVAVVRSDGHVSDKERKLLAMCMERWDLEPMLLKAFLAAPPSDISTIQPKSIEESRMLFRALAAAAYADGKIDDSEMQLLKMMARHLKLAPDEDYEIIKSLGPQRGYVSS